MKTKIIIWLITILILITTATALEFTKEPAINNNERPFLTSQNLVCSWESIGNVSQDIKWYKAESGTNLVYESTFDNSTMILSSTTSRGNRWMCEVIIHNDTDSTSINSSIAHLSPWLSFENDSVVPKNYNLTEDILETFYIKSADPESSGVTFSLTENTLCELKNSEGEIECTALHKHVAGTKEPGPETITPFSITIKEEVGEDSFGSTFNFTLIPVNDQAQFDEYVLDISEVALDAGDNWNYLVSGWDEELDYLLNFTVENVERIFGEGSDYLEISFSNNNDTSSYLNVNSDNQHVGMWSVTINVTDNGSSEFPPTNHTFVLEILRTSEPPIINVSEDLNGIQEDLFYTIVNATDPDNFSELNFNIELVSEGLCQEALERFSWNITDIWSLEVINNASDNASANISAELTVKNVICNKIKITVWETNDPSSKTEEEITFNITNVNDPPILYEQSYYKSNFLNQNNLSELSVYLFAPSATYRFNATDYDDFTYNANETGLSHFEVSDENFEFVDASKGILNLSFTNNSMIGNHLFEVFVFDKAGANTSRTVNLTIINNTPPRIEFPELINNSLQNNISLIIFNTTDLEGVSVGEIIFESFNERFNQEMYNLSLQKINSTIFNEENITTWALNFSNWINNKSQDNEIIDEYFANQLVGFHNLSIKVIDEFGAYSEELSKGNISFFVENENDPPFFVENKNENVSVNNLSFYGFVDAFFIKTIHATDFDLYLPSNIVNESLNFSIINSTFTADIFFDKVSSNSAELKFTPDQVGKFEINVLIEDAQGENDTIKIEVIIYEQTDEPVFEEIKPYYDEELIDEFISVNDSLANNVLNIAENSTLIFDGNISFDSKITSEGEEENNFIIVEWFVNNELVNQSEELEPFTTSGYNGFINYPLEYYFDFFSSGTNNITMSATDRSNSHSQWTWLLEVENVNRVPIYCNESIESEIRLSNSTILGNFLSFYGGNQIFYNPDDDSDNKGPETINPCNGSVFINDFPGLEFDYVEISPGGCYADFEFDGAGVTITGHRTGICTVQFIARDDYEGVAYSEDVLIVIEEAFSEGEVQAERVVTVTETVTVPLEHEVDVPHPTKIIYPGELIFYHNKTIEVPIIIKNNWTTDFTGISLRAKALNTSANPDDNMSISFSKKEIDLLREGEQEEITLYLTDYRKPGPLMINIFADVENPEFTDSDTLIIAGLEMAGDNPQSARALVTYARDLLTTSPECAELNDLLNNAQRMLEQGNAGEALRLVDAAINGCKYLLSQGEELRRENPGILKAGLNVSAEYWLEIVLGSVALIFVAIMFYVFAVVRMTMKNKD